MRMMILTVGDGNGQVKDTVDELARNSDAIILALIGVMATLVAGLVYVVKSYANTKIAAVQASAANAAVNNVGPGEHTLFTKVTHISDAMERLVAKQDEFDRKGWPSLPPDINTAVGLTSVIRELQHEAVDNHELMEKLEGIEGELREHVVWEMTQKYSD